MSPETLPKDETLFRLLSNHCGVERASGECGRSLGRSLGSKAEDDGGEGRGGGESERAGAKPSAFGAVVVVVLVGRSLARPLSLSSG